MKITIVGVKESPTSLPARMNAPATSLADAAERTTSSGRVSYDKAVIQTIVRGLLSSGNTAMQHERVQKPSKWGASKERALSALLRYFCVGVWVHKTCDIVISG